ncbi:MAG: OmpA family protein [Chitinophagales bacterium]|nr:OmpA family protein [Chitinophagales bacterium]
MRNLVLICFLFLSLQACKTAALNINSGELAYEQKKFVLAIDLLKQEISKENDPQQKLNKLYMLADVYAQINDAPGESTTRQEIADLDSNNPLVYLELGLSQKKNEDYESAITNLERYKSMSQDVFNSNPHIAACKEILDAQNQVSNLVVSKLKGINSSASDYNALPYKNSSLVFSSSRNSSTGDFKHPWNGEKNPDIFISNKNGNAYSTPESFSDFINTEKAEGGICFSKDFQKAYFTRCENAEFGNSYCKIYEIEADGDQWYEAKAMVIFSDTVNVGQAHLSADGNRLYFSSDAPYGFGGNDIYFIEKMDFAWSDPINAGFYINTEKDELFPTTDSEGNLYFSSNGRMGYGGLDIYKAAPDKLGFAQAEALPYPINCGADDFSFVFLKEKPQNAEDKILESAVFSSSRKGGEGSDDIYLYEKVFINLYELHLSIVEKSYSDSLDSESEVLGLKPLAGAIVLFKGQEKISASDGKLLFALEAESDYKILVTKTGYFNKSISFSTKGLSSRDSLLIKLYEEVELERIFPEKEIVIPNIYYDYDKASLRPESLPVLDQLISFFEENNDLRIEIGSHTDSRGSDKYNQDLSQRRAQSVVDYFIQKGVASAQLSAKGYGESKIINGCFNGVDCSEEKHQENRRTTFRVISAEGVLESQ